MKWKKYVAICLVMLFAVPFTVLAQAGVSEEDKAKIKQKQDELEQIEGRMGSKKKVLDEKKQKAHSAYQQLMEVERALKEAEDELAVIENNLKEVEGKIQENTEALRVIRLKYEDQVRFYNSRIRNIYKHGQINYVDLLLGAKDFSDFTTRFELLLKIMRSDIQLIEQMKIEQQNLREQQEKLQNNQEELYAVRRQADAKKQIIENRREQRKEIYQAAAAERDKEQREYQELVNASQDITNMIKDLESGGKMTGQGSGRMMWPVTGRYITSPYGWRTHPIYGSQRFHSGLDIAADYNDPVVAADNGVVISAGWISGYGYTVILDHGGGLTTLYAHNNELRVSQGQKVSKGQLIALVGSTGNSTGPHCHFEVRINGETTQPLDYLP